MKKAIYTILACLSGIHTYSQCSVTPAIGIFNHVSCFGGSDGSLTMGYTGGTGPFQYQLDGGPILSTPTFSGLAAGTYNCTIIDMGEGFCAETIPFTITQPASPLTVMLSPTNTTCNGACDGSVIASIFGGTAPYSFQWTYSTDGGATWTPLGIFSTSISGLCSALYRIQVTDASGCTTSQVTNLTSPPLFQANAVSVNENCGMCDGSASVSATGGTGGIAGASWSNGATTSAISGLCIGVYHVQIVDFNGCLAYDSVIVSSNSTLSAGSIITAASCDSCNGELEIIATGGSTPYQYSVDGGATFQSGNIFTGLCAVTYNFVVQDAAGCSFVQNAELAVPTVPGLTVSSTVINESGPGIGNGSIQVNTSGTTVPLSFDWSNGATTEDIFSLSTGVYNLIIHDTSGNCNYYSYFVNVFPSIGNINGQVFIDMDGNCVFSASDLPLNSVPIETSTITYTTYTNPSGYYNFNLPNNTYTVEPVLPSYVIPSTGCVVNDTAIVSSGSSTTINFPLEATGTYTDGSVNVYTNPINPGFSNWAYLTVCNNGITTLDGIAYVTIPQYTTYSFASPAPDAVSGDTLFFNVTGLAPGMCNYYTIYYACPANPALLGLISSTYAGLTVTSDTDVELSNNYDQYDRIIMGSYDPNDKAVSPAGDVLLNDTSFTYLIRFQNTGNAPAINIIVRDTLSNFLDYSTLQLLGASHDYGFTLYENKVMTWNFDSIMLPDSTNDEPNSHGWILFKIKRKNTVMVGDVIENTADIYFDFNPPVITNTTESEFVTPSLIQSIEKSNGILIFPNPANEKAFIVTPNRNGKISVTDMEGRIILQLPINSTTTEIGLGTLCNGIYFIQVENNTEIQTFKLIKN